MGTKKIIWAINVIVAMFACSAYGQNIEIVTEEYPPYNHKVDGNLVGVSTEVVRGRIQRMGEVIVKMIVLCVTFSDLINNV